MNVQVKIKNLPEIRSAFAKSPRIMTKNLNYAIKKSSGELTRQSQLITPHDTGRLKSSHEQRFSNLKATIQPTAEYAVFVHEGTRFMKARPFLADAAEITEGYIDAEFEHAVQKTLDEIGRTV